MEIYVSKDWLGLHLSAQEPTLVNSGGHLEWQRERITLYPAEVYEEIRKYSARTNTPKMNEVIKLQITFNITKL